MKSSTHRHTHDAYDAYSFASSIVLRHCPTSIADSATYWHHFLWFRKQACITTDRRKRKDSTLHFFLSFVIPNIRYFFGSFCMTFSPRNRRIQWWYDSVPSYMPTASWPPFGSQVPSKHHIWVIIDNAMFYKEVLGCIQIPISTTTTTTAAAATATTAVTIPMTWPNIHLIYQCLDFGKIRTCTMSWRIAEWKSMMASANDTLFAHFLSKHPWMYIWNHRANLIRTILSTNWPMVKLFDPLVQRGGFGSHTMGVVGVFRITKGLLGWSRLTNECKCNAFVWSQHMTCIHKEERW